jgi:hypothetical protein
MTVSITKNALNLREELASLRNQVGYHQETFWFTGTGSQTAFIMEKGWKPINVFSAGLLQKGGTGNAYTTIYDGFVWTITFAVAPALNAQVAIVGELA